MNHLGLVITRVALNSSSSSSGADLQRRRHHHHARKHRTEVAIEAQARNAGQCCLLSRHLEPLYLREAPWVLSVPKHRLLASIRSILGAPQCTGRGSALPAPLHGCRGVAVLPESLPRRARRGGGGFARSEVSMATSMGDVGCTGLTITQGTALLHWQTHHGNSDRAKWPDVFEGLAADYPSA